MAPPTGTVHRIEMTLAIATRALASAFEAPACTARQHLDSCDGPDPLGEQQSRYVHRSEQTSQSCGQFAPRKGRDLRERSMCQVA